MNRLKIVYNEHAKKPSFTKSGPGRYHRQGDGSNKSPKQLAAGSYGKGLVTWRNGRPSKGRV